MCVCVQVESTAEGKAKLPSGRKIKQLLMYWDIRQTLISSHKTLAKLVLLKYMAIWVKQAIDLHCEPDAQMFPVQDLSQRVWALGYLLACKRDT